MVCPSAPANEPGETWRAEPYVKYSYVSSEMWYSPRSRHSSLMRRSAVSAYTAPLGLLGEIVTIARVRLPIARAIPSIDGW